MLLALWGQDLVQRQTTNTKRTKEVYEKISEKFNQNGFERTADQVRTRVFNMIAEYRRILKDPNPERMKKCIFFEALHKIYQAKHMDDVKSALDDYEPEYPYSPASNTISSEKGDESISDSEATDVNETINNSTNSVTNNNSAVAATTAPNSNSCSTNDNNSLGDSNSSSNNNIDRETSLANSHSASAGGSSAKKIKLESPKSGQNQTNQPHTASASTSSASAPNSSSSSDHANTKQNKSSSTVSSASSTIGSMVGLGSSSAAAGAASSSSSSQRHQSLLLPHATSSATSTPISKLTTSGSNNTPSYINLNSINSKSIPIIRTNQLIGHPNGNESINLNGTTTRLPTTAAIASHQLYQAPVNTFDVTSSALLIDRMFAHLSRESENMREWIALEKERLALEKARRQQETEREVRRERVLIDTLMRFQEQWLTFLSRLDQRILDSSTEPIPTLRIPTKETTSSAEASQSTDGTNTNTLANSNNSNPPVDASKQ